MYIQQESLSQCGGFSVKIPSTNKNKKCKSRVKMFFYVSRKSENPTTHPEFETIQNEDPTFQ